MCLRAHISKILLSKDRIISLPPCPKLLQRKPGNLHMRTCQTLSVSFLCCQIQLYFGSPLAMGPMADALLIDLFKQLGSIAVQSTCIFPVELLQWLRNFINKLLLYGRPVFSFVTVRVLSFVVSRLWFSVDSLEIDAFTFFIASFI